MRKFLRFMIQQSEKKETIWKTGFDLTVIGTVSKSIFHFNSVDESINKIVEIIKYNTKKKTRKGWYYDIIKHCYVKKE
jgi:hypothetical protein